MSISVPIQKRTAILVGICLVFGTLSASNNGDCSFRDDTVKDENIARRVLDISVELPDDAVVVDVVFPDAAAGHEPSRAPTTEVTPEATPEKKEMPDPTGTNFAHAQQFNFSYIFIIGGRCNDPESQSTKCAEPGLGLLALPQASNICSPSGEAEFFEHSRDFHLNALKQVEERVADKLNKTLVITIDIGLETNWEPVVDLMRKGMAFSHGGHANEIINMNFAHFDLKPEKSSLHVHPACRSPVGQRNGKGNLSPQRRGQEFEDCQSAHCRSSRTRHLHRRCVSGLCQSMPEHPAHHSLVDALR